MSASPIVGDDLAPVTDGATACDHLRELSNTRNKMQEFLEWLLESDGDLAAGFKEALVQQMLFDEAKKGWFVRTNSSSGYLELVEKIPLAGISGSGVSDGDYLIYDSDAAAWVKQSPVYLAPTSGGATVPAISAGGLLSVAHGLGAAPRNYRCYLECNSADVGYAVGDRVDASGLIILRDTGGEQMQAVNINADATLVFAVFQVRSGAGGEYRLINKSTFARAAIDPSKWNVKFWALP